MMINSSRFIYLFTYFYFILFLRFTVLPWWCRIAPITKGNSQWFSSLVKQQQLARFHNALAQLKMCGSQQFLCLRLIYLGILSL